MNVKINERAFDDAIRYALTAVGLILQDEVVKVTPRDPKRLPIHNIDRKDGKPPKRRGRKPVQWFGHWYPGVTGSLKKSIAHGVDPRGYKVMVGVSSSGPAAKYAGYLEFGTPKMMPRSFLGDTVKNPKVQAKLADTFEKAFFERLERYN